MNHTRRGGENFQSHVVQRACLKRRAALQRFREMPEPYAAPEAARSER